MTNHARIITDRLILQPVSAEDMDIYTALLTSPETTRYLPGGKPFSEEYIANYLLQKIEHWKKGYGTFIVSLRNNPKTKIGYAGVEAIAESGFDDIRYALLSEFQGNGYALEAAKSVIEFTFANTSLDGIYGVAVTDNLPSARLLEKLGMTLSSARLYDSDDLITMSVTRADRRY